MNYADLKAAVADWAHRSNVPASTVDLFIDLAEAEFNNRLRCVEQETVADLACSGRYTTLPADFLEMRAVELQGARLAPIPYGSPEYMSIRGSSQPAGEPRAYSVIGPDLELMPAPTGATVTLLYWSRIPALSSTSSTNWLIEAHPNLYLLESLRQLSIWAKDDAGAARYANQLQGYWGALTTADAARRHPGPLRVRTA
ncbi:MAG: hypothetical protein LT106_18580 [Burkholderiaceae bacterium]|nr:hypothetical protein [Burkholderiaceae bacterium]